MNFIAKLRYRWTNFRDPDLFEFSDLGNGYQARVIAFGMFDEAGNVIDDVEKKIWKRRVRAVLTGCGGEWTMWGALLDYDPSVLFLLLLFLAAAIALRIAL